ncbi:peptidase inhibitor family I36 protein [Actinomadura sp. 9N215]|uniref:peptidase inhibitor family I36 protein n=1 Tax=Actinomadura sp. 9N215 TaxID=3375150 RepID=UPI0037B9D792
MTTRRLAARTAVPAALFLAALAPVGAVPSAHADSVGKSAAPAAAKGIGDCPSARLCVWAGESFTGLMTSFRVTGPGRCQFSSFHTYRSAYNNTSTGQRLWQYFPCTGANRFIAPDSAISRIDALSAVGA